MYNPLITIIVPCYNVENYLSKCIDSIITQTYANLEILLVDDGSPDKCGEICDNYAKKDNRITVIHKANGGLSDARNTALDIATGEYITLIDSDDYVANDYIEALYNAILDGQAEIAISLNTPFKEGELPTPPKKGNSIILSKEEALKKMFYQKGIDVSACARLYHKELFRGVRFPKGLLYEDLATTYKLLQKATRVAIVNYKSYFYLHRNTSIEGSPFNKHKLDSCLTIIKQLEKYKETEESIQKAINCKITSFVFHLLLQMDAKNTNKKILIDYIKRYRKKVIFDSEARKQTRIACILSYGGFKVLSTCFKVIKER